MPFALRFEPIGGKFEEASVEVLVGDDQMHRQTVNELSIDRLLERHGLVISRSRRSKFV